MPRYFAKAESGSFEIPTQGSHVASLYCLAFLGQHMNTFSNKLQELVGLGWETEETDAEGRPLTVLETVTYSLYERSKLFARIVALNGGQEPQPGFELRSLLGRSSILTVIHVHKGEKTFANVSAASPLPRTMDGHVPRGVIYFDLEEFDPASYAGLPKRFQRLADEAAGPRAPTTPPLAPGYPRPPASRPSAPPADDIDDGIPF